ncbi:MAG: hypothetical protein FVQ79_08500 [Planctomycetes bacterium]|nr:hypothetical protein [Planctomycetota bacterium]
MEFIVLLLLAMILTIAGIFRYGRKSINLLLLTNLIVTVPFTLCLIRFGYRPSEMLLHIMSLHFIIMIPMLIVSCMGLWDYGLDNKLASLIMILLFVACFFSLSWGHKLRMYVFEKRLPQYECAVEDCKLLIEGESLRLAGNKVPEKYRHLAHAIFAVKDNSGNIEIAFKWGYGRLFRHIAFYYLSDNKSLEENGPEHEKIKDHWYLTGKPRKSN